MKRAVALVVRVFCSIADQLQGPHLQSGLAGEPGQLFSRCQVSRSFSSLAKDATCGQQGQSGFWKLALASENNKAQGSNLEDGLSPEVRSFPSREDADKPAVNVISTLRHSERQTSMVPFNTLPSNSCTMNGETKPMGTDKSHEQSKSSVQSND